MLEEGLHLRGGRRGEGIGGGRWRERKGGDGKGREGRGGEWEWDAGPAGRQVPGAPHWQMMGLPTAGPSIISN